MGEETFDFSDSSVDEFYREDKIHELIDADEINTAEEGFMIGYLNA